MPKLLIADSSELFASKIREHLEGECQIEICTDADKLLLHITSFKPDVLLYDSLLTGIDANVVRRLLWHTGAKIKVVVLTYSARDYDVYSNLCGDDCMAIMRPCRPMYAVAFLRNVFFGFTNPLRGDWCLENEIDSILLSLGFRMGPNRYRCVFEAILYRYHNPNCAMKELYVDVASCCGGGRQRVEKAIRDAVEDAYSNSDTSLWAMYFPYYSKREKPYPGNEDFVARIAGALIQIARVHTPSGYRCAGTGY